MNFQFTSLKEKDLNLLHQWFSEPTVNHWFARSCPWSFEQIKQKYLPRIQGKENIPSFIAYQNNKPLGYIQYYCLKEFLPEGFQTMRINYLINIQLIK